MVDWLAKIELEARQRYGWLVDLNDIVLLANEVGWLAMME